ncbi:uncharacterized protein LOC144623775 [Crassostrea virginica]
MIDKDGPFLINIFWEPYMLKFEPISLSYEVERNVVWVGLDDDINTIIVYRHIDRKVALADDCNPTESIYTSPSYLEIDKWLHASDDDVFLEMESEYNDNNRQNFDEVEPSENNISFSGVGEEGEDEIYSEDF